MLDSTVVNHTMDAIRDPQKWQRVLQSIADATGAKAAMITLREKTTCQIVNDDRLEAEYHSPLIYGFSLSGVMFYLDELRTIDPWAEAQRLHHPHHPTLMSQVLDPRTHPDRRFFDWLNAQGIEDTIAVELDLFSDHWTAFNLFLERQDAPENQRAMEFMAAHAPFLRNAWQTSQEFTRKAQSNQAALDQLSRFEIPACVVSEHGTVSFSNEAFAKLSEMGVVNVMGTRKTLSLAETIRPIRGGEEISGHFTRHAHSKYTCNMNAVPFHPDPLYKDKKQNLWLLTFQVTNAPDRRSAGSFNTETLTTHELKLFNQVRDGKRIEDAGKTIGVGRSRTYEIWGAVKEKLNISNAHQIRR